MPVARKSNISLVFRWIGACIAGFLSINAAAQSLKLTTNSDGVPVFPLIVRKKIDGKEELFRAKNIPLLNLPRVPELQVPPSLNPKLVEIPPLQVPRWAPPVITNLADSIPPKSSQPFTAPSLTQAPEPIGSPLGTRTQLAALKPVSEPKVEEAPPLKPAELKLLQAQIYLKIHKNYPLAFGLLAEVIEEAPETRDRAKMYLGLTSLELGLYNEFKEQLLSLVQNSNPDLKKKALAHLVTHIQPGDLKLVVELNEHLEEIPVESSSQAVQYQINRAKFFSDQGQLKEALELLLTLRTSEAYTKATSVQKAQASLLQSLLLYKSNKLDEALDALKSFDKAYPEKKDLPSLLADTLYLTQARLEFQKGLYQDAFSTYLKLNTKNSQWLAAMVERAWAQILVKDYQGAAGNMFSLHTDFLKNRFHPESYTVRTVSYLNLCQFGDALKVVGAFEQKYQPIFKELTDFKGQINDPQVLYSTIKKWSENPTQEKHNGLSSQFLFALTQAPLFQSHQEDLNSIEDQITKLNRLTLDLIAQERAHLKKLEALRKKLAEEDKEEAQQALHAAIEQTKIHHYVAKKSRTSIRTLRQNTFARLEALRTEARTGAGLAALSVLDDMVKSLEHNLAQTDVLKYEIFSGLGEQVRFEVTGGPLRKPSQQDQQQLLVNKKMTWDFKGEIWQDEIGHFRSSLEDRCPQLELTKNN